MDSLYSWSDTTKIGVACTGLGVCFTLLGVIMLLDSVLLTMGNAMFVAGVALVMGPVRFKTFFQARPRASLCFFVGMLLVLFRWCLLGMMIQGFGTLNLFGNFFPMVARVLESLPVIGPIILTKPVQKLLSLLQLANPVGVASMELTVNGKNVVFTTHKTFCEVGEVAGLHAVLEYAPFRSFLASCEERDPVPTSILIRAIFRIAHRVTGVIADVEYAIPGVPKQTQTINLTDTRSVILMPVVEVGEQKYGLLLRQHRLALGFQPFDEAIYGTEDARGGISCDAGDALERLGIDLAQATAVGERTYTIGNEGSMPYKIYTVTITLSEEKLRQLDGRSQDGIAAPLALPLADISSKVQDVKANLAVSLLLSR